MTKRGGGLPYAIAAYGAWGLLPLYLRLVHHVPSLEFVGWRVLFTVPVCLAIVALRREFGALRAALANPRALGALAASAVLIAVNWTVYVIAIQAGHIYAASLGYYINPLVNVLAGVALLGERLGRRQWLAVALAGAGVAVLAWGAAASLGIALTLALSFAAYGLVRKLAPAGALEGLTVESLLLVVPAALLLVHYAGTPAGSALGEDAATDWLLAGAGVVTAVPLLMFAEAARRMDYSTLGFVQYLAPTLVFLLGLLVFHEPIKPVQLASFGLIWAGIALYLWDAVSAHRTRVVDEPPA